MKRGISLFLIALFVLLPVASAKLSYYHYDLQGNVRHITNSNGNVIEESKYLPFGERFDSDMKDVHGFTGKELDNSDNYYFNARYQSPQEGRFLTPDTVKPDLENPQSLNLYTYTLNNPIKYVDPSGEVVETVADAVSVGLSAMDLYNDPSLTNVAWLGGDIVAMFVPFLPSTGLFRKGAKSTIKVAGEVKVLPKRHALPFKNLEELVLEPGQKVAKMEIKAPYLKKGVTMPEGGVTLELKRTKGGGRKGTGYDLLELTQKGGKGVEEVRVAELYVSKSGLDISDKYIDVLRGIDRSKPGEVLIPGHMGSNLLYKGGAPRARRISTDFIDENERLFKEGGFTNTHAFTAMNDNFKIIDWKETTSGVKVKVSPLD